MAGEPACRHVRSCLRGLLSAGGFDGGWGQGRAIRLYACAGSFFQYTDGQGNKNGTIYNEPIGYGDQFFWQVVEASGLE